MGLKKKNLCCQTAMLLNKKKLIGLPVFTQSGTELGVVNGFELETTSHSINKYLVGSRKLIKGLLDQELVIDRGQVLSLSDQKMVVDDLAVGEGKDEKAEIAKKAVPAG